MREYRLRQAAKVRGAKKAGHDRLPWQPRPAQYCTSVIRSDVTVQSDVDSLPGSREARASCSTDTPWAVRMHEIGLPILRNSVDSYCSSSESNCFAARSAARRECNSSPPSRPQGPPQATSIELFSSSQVSFCADVEHPPPGDAELREEDSNSLSLLARLARRAG